jgi:predicted dehydrogenase
VIRFGVIGLGFMGRTHLANLARHKRAQVAAVHDVEPDRLFGPLAPGGGNLDAGGKPWDESEVRRCPSAQELLSAEDLDAVVVATPSHLHARFCLQALKAGKHVFCEKPMALSLADCDRMLAAAARSRRVLMVGHCIRFWGEYVAAAKIARSRRHGALRAMRLTRRGGYPSFGARNWFADYRQSGGALLDLHIHDVDYALFLLGPPRAVRAFGYVGATGGVDHVVAWYDYGRGGPVVEVEGSWVPGAAPFEMAFAMHFERASLEYSLRGGTGLQLYARRAEKVQVPAVSAYEAEMDHFIRRVLAGRCSLVVPPESSRLSVAVALAEGRSIRTHRRVPLP